MQISPAAMDNAFAEGSGKSSSGWSVLNALSAGDPAAPESAPARVDLESIDGPELTARVK